MSDTLAALRAALAKGATAQDLNKAATFIQSTSATTGLTEYDLEPVAKELYPVLTPLLKMIPRVSGHGGIQANWKVVKSISGVGNNLGVGEGQRGKSVAVTTGDYYAAYRSLGKESSLTFEAEEAAEGFDDLKARAVHVLLQSKMLGEEAILLGSNSIYGLGTSPTPSLVTSTTGGAIGASAACYVVCVALTYDGYISWAAGDNAGTVLGQYTQTNADGTTTTVNGGAAIASAAANITTGAGSTNSVTASLTTPKQGAYAYAWFVGSSASASAQWLYSVTTVAQVLITSIPGSGQALGTTFTADYSQNTLVHDGLLGFCGNPANGSYYAAATNGAGLTPDGSGGIVEFDTALKYFWDVWRLSPDAIYVNSQELNYIRKKILAGQTSANATRFVFDVQQGTITGGGMAKGYLNPFNMSGVAKSLDLVLHPNMPPGTVLFVTHKLPYPLANISNLMNVRCRRDNYQIEWPRTNRQYAYGVYSSQVLQHYFPQSMGIITNLSAA
jgi:hypothetical protein